MAKSLDLESEPDLSLWPKLASNLRFLCLIGKTHVGDWCIPKVLFYSLPHHVHQGEKENSLTGVAGGLSCFEATGNFLKTAGPV